jgi:hypothetical protein
MPRTILTNTCSHPIDEPHSLLPLECRAKYFSPMCSHPIDKQRNPLPLECLANTPHHVLASYWWATWSTSAWLPRTILTATCSHPIDEQRSPLPRECCAQYSPSRARILLMSHVVHYLLNTAHSAHQYHNVFASNWWATQSTSAWMPRTAPVLFMNNVAHFCFNAARNNRQQQCLVKLNFASGRKKLIIIIIILIIMRFWLFFLVVESQDWKPRELNCLNPGKSSESCSQK